LIFLSAKGFNVARFLVFPGRKVAGIMIESDWRHAFWRILQMFWLNMVA